MGFRDNSSLHYWGEEDEEHLILLRERFPDWRIWYGQDEKRKTSGWYAIRPLPSEEGSPREIEAETALALTRLLEKEDTTSP
ncbi:hypothetical protein [Streptosporangium jomthongense]|uniref:Uncharacterized protein n=1 Tax=Streptosporangium jomthongense TaxID=1193683 RepID=A0ABV8F9W5_9ACTN